MMEAWGYFALGLVLLALGGDSIVKGASGLAQRFGASPFVAGLLLIAFGTSLPELAVNARAVWAGAQELALGNAVGSNIVNLGLTLGMAVLVAPVVIRMRVLSSLLVLLGLASLALIVFGLDGVVSRVEGLVLLLGFVAVLAFLLARASREDARVRIDVETFSVTHTVLWMNLLRFAVAAALLYYGARFVLQGAPMIGAQWGLSPLLTGLLPVAIGTALPEIAAAVLAARRGQGEVVVGHVIGSSLCNLTLVLGGIATFRTLALPASFVRFEVPAAIAFAVALYPMLRGDLRISKVEGGILVAAYVAWLVFVLATAAG